MEHEASKLLKLGGFAFVTFTTQDITVQDSTVWRLKVDPLAWNVVGEWEGGGKWSLAPMWAGMCVCQDSRGH